MKKLALIALILSVGQGYGMSGGGAGKDPSGHNCAVDGGYTWCPYYNQCVRSWVRPCPSGCPGRSFKVSIKTPPYYECEALGGN